MDGLEICRRLRADPRTVALPVVLLTGRTSVDDVVAGLDAGADDFLAKPFNEAELLARLRSARRLALVMAEMEGAQGVVAALANAVEAKDSMTEDHCQRLAGLAHVLATASGLEPASIKGIVFGALLHDIGKIGVVRHHPQEAGPADRGGVAGDAPATRSSGSRSAARCRARASSRRSSAITTSAGTARAIPTG